MTKTYSKTVSQLIAASGQRYAYPPAAVVPASAPPLIIHQHFTVANETVRLQAPAWSDYVSRTLESPVSRSQLVNGFRGEIDTYVLKDMIYMDIRTDALLQARTATRISRDNMRDYVFHVAVEGIIETVTGSLQQCKSAQFVPGILALDMGQPMRMTRPTYARVLAFFLPRAIVESEIPDAQSIHGKVVAYTSPLTRLILDHLLTLCRHLPTMDGANKEHAIRTCAQLIVAAFGKQTRLSGGARASANAAMFDKIQRYIQENLYRQNLSPESVLLAFPLPRATLYRMFEHEGGLAVYIRNCRLHKAANELIKSPETAVMEIAYKLCFSSASHFTHVFHRAYGMAPQEFRALGMNPGHP